MFGVAMLPIQSVDSAIDEVCYTREEGAFATETLGSAPAVSNQETRDRTSALPHGPRFRRPRLQRFQPQGVAQRTVCAQLLDLVRAESLWIGRIRSALARSYGRPIIRITTASSRAPR